MAAPSIRLDPWTVYGDTLDVDEGMGTVVVNVPDIGVLPPAGRYLGSIVSIETGAATVPALVTVRAENPAGRSEPRLTLEFLTEGGGPQPAEIAVRFEAFVTG